MKSRSLGSSGIDVSEIGYGAMHLSIDKAKRPSEEDAIALIRHAVDTLGITLIDTADSYCIDERDKGHNERVIAEALSDGRKERVTVATKGGLIRPEGRWERNGQPAYLRAACEASLKALRTDTIDIYQLHAPDPLVPIADSVGTLADMQREGKIRHIGVSNVTIDELEIARGEAEIVSVQNRYSVFDRRDQDALLAFCEKNAIAYLPWNPIGGRGNAPEIGKVFTDLDEISRSRGVAPHAVVIAWLLQHSPALIPIPGTTKIEHLEQNIAGATLALTDEEIETLDMLEVEH